MAEASPLPLIQRIQSQRGGTDPTCHQTGPTKRPKLTTPSQLRDQSEKAQPSLQCSLKSCSKGINPRTEKYVEIQAGLSEDRLAVLRKKCAVSWSKHGEATFHIDCWTELSKSSRARNPKRVTIKMPVEEKALVKEASKTAEFHDSSEQVQQEAERIVTLLRNARHCVVFTGAGISTSAGIGDYRGKGGKWTEMDREAVTAMVAESLAQGEASQGTSATGEEETDEEGVPYEKLRPTYTHEALVKLLETGFVKHIISQNGDGLHSLSGIPPGDLSELHGNVFLEVCEKCDHRYYRPFYVMDDHASLYYEELSDNGTTSIVKPKHAKQCDLCGLSHRTGRRCEQNGCKGYLKDSIINFRDNLEEEILTNAEKHAQQADLLLSLGTTMQVTPACNLVEMGQNPIRLVIVNRQKTGFDDLCYARQTRGKKERLGARVFGDCDEVMREVMAKLMEEGEREAWERQRGERMMDYERQRQA